MPRPTPAGMAAAGRAVRAWRADETQAEVAARAGIDTDTLGSLEAGTTWPWNRTLRAVERALGRPPGELDRIAAGVAPDGAQSPPSLLDDALGAKNARLIRKAARAYPDGGDEFLRAVENELSRRSRDDDG